MPLAVAFSILIIGPWLFGRATAALRLPAILGMLLFGVLYASVAGGVVNLVPPLPGEVEELSFFIKRVALIVILLRAGLGIRRTTLQEVGVSAIRMALIPCLLETAAAAAAFAWLFQFDLVTALVGASILAAVSPAVVVPSMLLLKEHGYGRTPTLILAGASVDNAVAITIFGAALGLAAGGRTSVGAAVIALPVSVLIGLVAGASWYCCCLVLLAQPRRRPASAAVVFRAWMLETPEKRRDGPPESSPLLVMVVVEKWIIVTCL